MNRMCTASDSALPNLTLFQFFRTKFPSARGSVLNIHKIHPIHTIYHILMTTAQIRMSKGLNCRYEPNVHSLKFGGAEYGFGAAEFHSLSILSNEIVLYTRKSVAYTQNTPYPNVQCTDLNEYTL